MPGELLIDEASLPAISMEERNCHTIVFRAKAQKAAAPVNVTHSESPILRKTAHMRVEDITPGAKCAMWRSQLRGKGPRKRGGYVIGIVTFDGTCAWVQLGVDRNQFNPAYGFEAWSLDEDELRDAEQNFLSGELHIA